MLELTIYNDIRKYYDDTYEILICDGIKNLIILVTNGQRTLINNKLLKPLVTNAAQSVARGQRPREGDGIHFRLPTWVAGGAVSDTRFG